jgi:hypothetical protein
LQLYPLKVRRAILFRRTAERVLAAEAGRELWVRTPDFIVVDAGFALGRADNRPSTSVVELAQLLVLFLH